MPSPENQVHDWLDYIKSIGPLVVSLVLLYWGTFIKRKDDSKKSLLSFQERQLRELYGPLWGYRREIEVLSDRRVEVGRAYDSYANKYGQYYSDLVRSGKKEKADEFLDGLTSDNAYNETQLKEKLLPHYRLMNDTIRSKIELADQDVLENWPKLIRFIDNWDRTLEGTMHPEIAEKVQVREATLHEFYSLLERKVATLRIRVERNDPYFEPDLLASGALPLPFDDVDKPDMLALLEGITVEGTNIDPKTVENFIWAADVSKNDPQGEHAYIVATEAGEIRRLRISLSKPSGHDEPTSAFITLE